MKRVVTMAGEEIARGAAELAGGRHYAHRGPIDRMIRDLGAARYHPIPPRRRCCWPARARRRPRPRRAGDRPAREPVGAAAP